MTQWLPPPYAGAFQPT